MLLYKQIARRIPGLGLKLQQARLSDTPHYYVQKTFLSAIMTTLSLVMIAFMFARDPMVLLAIPFLFIFSFVYFLRFVDIKIAGHRNKINQEIVFAGRFLIIELESGVPLYNAMVNIAKNYECIGTYFGEIAERVDLGTTMEEAINETISTSPSAELRKVLWQILNSMKTGADINRTLNAVIDQIVREQKIEIAEYGRKLNPLAMFYMMIAVIIPSLGIVFLTVMASFIGIPLSLGLLLIISAGIGFVQFMFMAIIKANRPAVEL